MSNKTKWAPGPWRCDQRQIIAPKNDESRGGLVATCRGSAHTRTIANANARLIAAAPELYEALHDMITSYERLGSSLPMAKEVEVALDALAKARGE